MAIGNVSANRGATSFAYKVVSLRHRRPITTSRHRYANEPADELVGWLFSGRSFACALQLGAVYPYRLPSILPSRRPCRRSPQGPRAILRAKGQRKPTERLAKKSAATLAMSGFSAATLRLRAKFRAKLRAKLRVELRWDRGVQTSSIRPSRRSFPKERQNGNESAPRYANDVGAEQKAHLHIDDLSPSNANDKERERERDRKLLRLQKKKKETPPPRAHHRRPFDMQMR